MLIYFDLVVFDLFLTWKTLLDAIVMALHRLALESGLDNEYPRTSELAPPPNYDSAFENISETGNNFTNDRLPTYEEALKMWKTKSM